MIRFVEEKGDSRVYMVYCDSTCPESTLISLPVKATMADLKLAFEARGWQRLVVDDMSPPVVHFCTAHKRLI